MRELEMLSKQGEAASQLLMQDALQFFQSRYVGGAGTVALPVCLAFSASLRRYSLTAM
jgi:xylose isomerase